MAKKKYFEYVGGIFKPSRVKVKSFSHLLKKNSNVVVYLYL